MKYLKLLEERDPAIARLRELGLADEFAGMDWRLEGEVGGTSNEWDQQQAYDWTGPAGEHVVSVVGKASDFKTNFTVELSNGATLRVDFVMDRKERMAGRPDYCSVKVNGQDLGVGLVDWAEAVWSHQSVIMPALEFYEKRASTGVNENRVERLIELGMLNPDEIGVAKLVTMMLGERYPGVEFSWNKDGTRLRASALDGTGVSYFGRSVGSRFSLAGDWIWRGSAGKALLIKLSTDAQDPDRVLNLALQISEKSTPFLDAVYGAGS